MTDTKRLARAVLEYQLLVIREACLRRGQSPEDADEVVGTCLKEFREGDTDCWIFCARKRSIKPQTEETIMTTKYTTPGAAGVEVDRRAERHMAEHSCTYREAWHAILAADPELRQAYAMPAATKPAPAIPVTTDDEREILDWIMRALKDNMVGSLPGALGNLTIEADTFKKLGMPIEEAVRRAMDGNEALVTMAKLLLADVRRNTPVPAGETAGLAQGMPAGEVVHSRAQALIAKHPHLDYHEAMGAVFAADPGLKARYAGVQ